MIERLRTLHQRPRGQWILAFAEGYAIALTLLLLWWLWDTPAADFR